MVRRNLLKDLIEAPAAPAAPGRLETKAARAPSGGAIGAVSQGIAELRARAVVDLDPFAIRAGGLLDRLEHDEAGHAKLMEQIREHGQQVPVLVRPAAGEGGGAAGDRVYQIVYGRRRVLACRDLGIPVRAMVREMGDDDLILAQGQENTARRDLTFIEKANFARQMVGKGMKRKLVCDALSVDKTELSRMLSVAARVPEAAIHAIGPAPAAGRARWLRLAGLIDETATTEAEACVLAHGDTSDQRFEALLKALTLPARRAAERRRAERRRGARAGGGDAGRDPPRPPAPPGRGMRLTAGGGIIGRVHEDPDGVVLSFEPGDAFARWLVGALPELYCDWLERTRGHRVPDE